MTLSLGGRMNLESSKLMSSNNATSQKTSSSQKYESSQNTAEFDSQVIPAGAELGDARDLMDVPDGGSLGDQARDGSDSRTFERDLPGEPEQDFDLDGEHVDDLLGDFGKLDLQQESSLTSRVSQLSDFLDFS